jgi:hypothetical protein
LRPYDSKLPVAVLLRVLNATIEKGKFRWFESILKQSIGLLTPEQRITVILNALDAAMAYYYDFEYLWKSFGSELPDERRIVVLLNAFDVAIKRSEFYVFNKWLRSFGFELSDVQHRTVAINGVDVIIRNGYGTNDLGELLEPYGPKLLVSWAIEQFKKIHKKANVAYSSKAIQQGIKVEGEALTEVQSISLAVNKYQEKMQSKSMNEDMNEAKYILDSLLDSVKHAHHLFTSLYTTLHPIDVDME